jgi:proteasome inhibitor subunit 1 (PI31)
LNPNNLFSPPSLFQPGGGDGMFVGPDHPIFSGRGRGSFGDRGPWGGDGYLPPMGAPPGARFDPVGPGLGPFHGRGGFGGLGRGRADPSRQGNVGSPDNDEFMPPGAVSLLIFLQSS